MARKEKGRRTGDPIPNAVLADSPEFKSDTLKLQAQTLAQRFGLSPATAKLLASLAFESEGAR